jgi:hypothetical protein
VDRFQNREFPWAIVQLWEFLATTATAANEPEIAEQARCEAAQVAVMAGGAR